MYTKPGKDWSIHYKIIARIFVVQFNLRYINYFLSVPKAVGFFFFVLQSGILETIFISMWATGGLYQTETFIWS